MTRKKIAEYIRIGVKMHPAQAFESLFYTNASCAWGAAMDGALAQDGIEHAEFDFRARIATHWMTCPQCFTNWINVLVHLNDDHHWTREKIADWLESTEPARKPEKAEEEKAPYPNPAPVEEGELVCAGM